MGSQIGALFSGLWGDAGQEFVDLQGGPDKVFGTKPDVADFTPTILSAETNRAIAGNAENFGAITDFLNKLVPGFSDILAKGLGNTASEVAGEIPQDVQDQVLRSTAFQSLQGGFGGTNMGRSLTARDLGLTSLNLTQMGQNSMQAWSSLAEQAYSPWTVTTSQQAAATAANNAGEQANKQFKFNVAAAPDPGAAGIFNVDAALGQQMLSIGAGFAGGAMGGGGSSSGGATAAVAPSGSGAWQLYGAGPSGASPSYTYMPSTGGYQEPVYYSDRRIKDNIVQVGTSPDGHKIVEFNYKGSDSRWRGVIAQEVMMTNPEAVSQDSKGFLRVNYDKLGLKMEEVR